MNREEAMQRFMEIDVKPTRDKILRQLSRDIRLNKDEWAAQLTQPFIEQCQKIQLLQRDNNKEAIKIIQFSLLRSSLIEGKLELAIDAFNEEYYMDPVPCQTKYLAAWLYPYVKQLEDILKKEFKKFIQKILICEVESIIQKELEHFIPFVVALVRYAVPNLMQLPEFQEVNKTLKWDIRVGEYLDAIQLAYLEDQTLDHKEASLHQLKKSRQENFSFEDFTQSDLSNGVYTYHDFSHAKFSESTLVNNNMSFSLCIGTNFSNSNLSGIHMVGVQIQDTNFQNCNCTSADFMAASTETLIDEIVIPSLSSTCFDGANLENANFTHAKLRDASFIGANLTGAKFLQEIRDELNLSEEQKSVIHWVVESDLVEEA